MRVTIRRHEPMEILLFVSIRAAYTARQISSPSSSHQKPPHTENNSSSTGANTYQSLRHAKLDRSTPLSCSIRVPVSRIFRFRPSAASRIRHFTRLISTRTLACVRRTSSRRRLFGFARSLVKRSRRARVRLLSVGSALSRSLHISCLPALMSRARRLYVEHEISRRSFK
jgi:hypothetical protein